MTMYRKSESENHLQPVRSAPFSDHYQEKDLETLLEQNPAVLAEGEPLLIINRQTDARESGIPDLIALDADGNIVIVELKRGRSPRDVIAQALEYTAWASGLDEDAIQTLAAAYLARREPETNLPSAWQEAFGQAAGDGEDLLPVLPQLNRRQRIILVLEGRDDRVRNVVDYLRKHGIDINIVEYLYYRTRGGDEFLDIEAAYTPQESTGLQPSESALLAGWPPEARETYQALKETLLVGDDAIRAEPKSKTVSFYKQIRDGRVFIGTFEVYTKTLGYWFRRDSLENYLDLETVVEGIKDNVPPDIMFRYHSTHNLSFGFSMRPEDGRAVAGLILEHITKELEG